MTKSRVLQKLRSGEIVRVAGIGRVTDPWLAEVVGRMGYDVIWFDLEHRAYGYDKIDPLSLACRATAIDLMVRVRKTSYDSPMRALEFGANGIMVPHCQTADEARQWVDWVRFPPLGRRGLDGVGADADFGLADTREHILHANREVFLALQIEDKEAVEHIEEIASVPGVDLLFIGPGDLSVSLGVPLQFDHPLVNKAIERIACAAAKADRSWGGATANPVAAQKLVDMGARMITLGADHVFLIRGFRQALEDFSTVRISA